MCGVAALNDLHYLNARIDEMNDAKKFFIDNLANKYTAINSNAKSMLRFLPVGDAIDLALQTQSVRGLSSETQALLEEKEKLQAENKMLADNNAAQAEVRKAQAEKIMHLEANNTS